jgi:clan AA aspartic protease (TIGR02281 family)
MAASPTAAPDLAGFLARHGFVAIPLTQNAVGHFEVAALVNGRPARLLLDTGASKIVCDAPSVARLGLRTSPTEARASGVGASDHAMETTTVDELRLGGVTLRALSAWAFDLGHVNRGLAAHGGPPIDGAIGGDVLRPAEAVIDCARATLYLRPPGRPGVVAGSA